MTTHSARTRTGGIQKNRIEQDALTDNIDLRKRRIKIAAISGRKFDTLSKIGLFQALAIDFAFCCRKIHGNMASM